MVKRDKLKENYGGRPTRLLQHLHRHIQTQLSFATSDQVLPEIHLAFTLTVGFQGGQRFAIGTALARLWVEGGHDAARAALDHTKLQLTDTDTLPAVFGIRLARSEEHTSELQS